MYEALFTTIITKEELNHFLTSLDALHERLYSVKTSLLDEINTTLPFDMKAVFLDLCQKNQVNLTNPQSLKSAIAAIRNEAEQLPILDLTIAYSPTEEQLKELSLWFTNQVGEKYIFAITVKAEMVGGAVVSAHGLYKDFTLQRFLKEHYRTST